MSPLACMHRPCRNSQWASHSHSRPPAGAQTCCLAPQILDVFAAVDRLHLVDAQSLRKSAAKAKSVGAPLVFSLSRGPNKPAHKVQRSFPMTLWLQYCRLLFQALIPDRGAPHVRCCHQCQAAARLQGVA